MNFLAIPYLFPILAITGLLAYPLFALGRSLVGVVRDYRSLRAVLRNLSRKEALVAAVLAQTYAFQGALKRYAEGLVRVLAVGGSWAAVVLVVTVLALPTYLVSVPIGVAKWLVMGCIDFGRMVVEETEEWCAERMDAILKPAARSVGLA